MRHTEEGNEWDFTPVIDLLYVLTNDGEIPYSDKEFSQLSASQSKRDLPPLARTEIYEHDTQLGNFDNIFKCIGQPPDSKSWEGLKQNGIVHNACDELSIKGVRWRDEVDDEAIAENDDKMKLEVSQQRTKTQRKKDRRRQRRLEDTVNNKIVPSSSSEDERSSKLRRSNSPRRKDVIYQILYGSSAIEADTKANNRIFEPKTPTPGLGSRVMIGHAHARNRRSNDIPDEEALAKAVSMKARLIKMLQERFLDEQQYLNNITLLQHSPTHGLNVVEGLHIFIDASNIMIGFHDALKISRTLPITQRIRRQPISFHSLSLILSRGRPTTKRIVVGSDNFSEMQEAKEIGYETNVLDRVHKAKELTPRQKKYMPNGNSSGTRQSAGSGSETTTAAQYAPEKWVEQAVDEILHLKMMESIVDASEPSTMVLATGDAAEAEYSGGFLRMVERALMKGWKVELASFRHNTSGAYRNKEFRQKWGQKFKIVELDDFVEVLLRAG